MAYGTSVNLSDRLDYALVAQNVAARSDAGLGDGMYLKTDGTFLVLADRLLDLRLKLVMSELHNWFWNDNHLATQA